MTLRDWVLLPYRILREWGGYNLCFFGLHRWREGGRTVWGRYGERMWEERYKLCKRCRTIKLPSEYVYEEEAR